MNPFLKRIMKKELKNKRNCISKIFIFKILFSANKQRLSNAGRFSSLEEILKEKRHRKLIRPNIFGMKCPERRWKTSMALGGFRR